MTDTITSWYPGDRKARGFQSQSNTTARVLCIAEMTLLKISEPLKLLCDLVNLFLGRFFA